MLKRRIGTPDRRIALLLHSNVHIATENGEIWGLGSKLDRLVERDLFIVDSTSIIDV